MTIHSTLDLSGNVRFDRISLPELRAAVGTSLREKVRPRDPAVIAPLAVESWQLDFHRSHGMGYAARYIYMY